jgi:two-component system, OmpR family, response regulator ArlR
MRILIVDDDVHLLDALKRVLEMNKFEVDCSCKADQAITMLASKEYDFVLVDYKMPGNDGIWFMENARFPSKTRVLLITAYVNRDVINRMFALGASGYLIKPFDEEELMRNIRFFKSEEWVGATDGANFCDSIPRLTMLIF